MTINSTITDQVEALLASRGQTQASLGPVLGLSQPSVNDRFRRRTPWTTADLERVAQHFGIDVADLLMPRAVPA